MLKYREKVLCLAAFGLFAGAASACSDEAPPATTSGAGAAGGAGGSSGSSGFGNTPSTGNVELTPSDLGWVEGIDNDVGIQGSWYPYGDPYGAAKCMNVGMHQPTECSLITVPKPPPDTGFPNTGGKMCTTGEATVILPCLPGVTTQGCPEHDFSNMWGAGIGFDFNAHKGPPDGDGAKSAWNPDDHGVIGVSFELDAIPTPGLRVEFPIRLTDAEASAVSLPLGSTTDDHPDGAPYWRANAAYAPSPVVTSPQVNTILWDAVKKPGSTQSYVFDKARLLGIQFHVPAVQSAPRGAYSFCISKLTLLRN